MSSPTRVLIWNEYRHEQSNPRAKELYPRGMHDTIASGLRADSALHVETATLDEPGHGLSEERLRGVDVLIWWGHIAHGEVSDEATDLVVRHVWQGMGAVFLHSAHFSKPFKRLMGTGCDLKWRESDDREILWVTRPGHPIVAGIEDKIVLPNEEKYGEHFDVPDPDELVMISSFTGGEVCRSLMTWHRGAGRVAYFRPGHETYPTYHHAQVIQVIRNACHWATNAQRTVVKYGNRPKGWLD